MNLSPYSVLQDQQSLQSGQYLYMLHKIPLFQGEKYPGCSNQNALFF